MIQIQIQIQIFCIFIQQEQIGYVIDAMQEKKVAAGDVIITEGDEEADFFYVVDRSVHSEPFINSTLGLF